MSTGPHDRGSMGKRELHVVHPGWTPWYGKSSGTNELEGRRGQIAQTRVLEEGL